MTTARDLVVEELAGSEAALLERVQALEDDVASYRFWLCAALARLASVTKTLERSQRTVYELQDLIRKQRQAA